MSSSERVPILGADANAVGTAPVPMPSQRSAPQNTYGSYGSRRSADDSGLAGSQARASPALASTPQIGREVLMGGAGPRVTGSSGAGGSQLATAGRSPRKNLNLNGTVGSVEAGGSDAGGDAASDALASPHSQPTPMIMSRTHPQYHRKAYIEAGVKFAREKGETQSQAGAFDHLLDYRNLDFENMEEALVDQMDWIDHFFFKKAKDSRSKKSSSASIIFTIWTTMCGSTMLTLPWAFAEAGFMMSLIVFFGGFCVSLYTCRMIYVQSLRMQEKEYFRIIRKMSPIIEVGAQWTSTLVLVVALMSYHKYATQCILGLTSTRNEFLQNSYVAITFGVVQFFISFVKNLGPLFKLSTFSIVFVLFNMSFIVIKSIQVANDSSLCPNTVTTPSPPINSTLEFEEYSFGADVFYDWDEGVVYGASPHKNGFSLYKSTWPRFAAVLCLSFFLHNLICPILDNSASPGKAARDHFLGYAGTALCYMLPGLSALFGYRNCLEGSVLSNFLDPKMFPADDYFAFVCRICVLMQNSMVYPLLTYLCRSQVFEFFRDSPYLNHTRTNSAVCFQFPP